MAGGTGVQYYFGTSFAESDLTLQDFRSRDTLWTQSKNAIDFFKSNSIPIQSMDSNNSLLSVVVGANAKCLATDDLSTIVVYLKSAVTIPMITLSGSYNISWYNPRIGGPLLTGLVTTITAGGVLGSPPTDLDKDWVILLQKA
jgi:hypothetical protein